MRIAYFDCFSVISVDMVLGAILDAGLELDRLNGEIAKLGLSDVAIERATTSRHALAATCAWVRAGDTAVKADHEHHLE